MRKLLIISGVFLCTSFTAFSQSSENQNSDSDPRFDRGATYGEGYRGSDHKKRKKVKYENLDFEKKKKEFEKRLEANAKKKKKIAKEMEKPQYSDPTYFGHKKKPRKRKPGKKKYCKECDLVH